MDRVFWLVDGLLAGRPGPDLEPWLPRTLAESGFRSVLSVHDQPPNSEELSAVGIRSVWHPLPLDIPPTDATAQACRAVLPMVYSYLSSELEAERPVLVHCLGGCDRTGLVLSHFLVGRANVSAEDAIAQVRRVRPQALSMPGWHSLAVDVLSGFSAG